MIDKTQLIKDTKIRISVTIPEDLDLLRSVAMQSRIIGIIQFCHIIAPFVMLHKSIAARIRKNDVLRKISADFM